MANYYDSLFNPSQPNFGKATPQPSQNYYQSLFNPNSRQPAVQGAQAPVNITNQNPTSPGTPTPEQVSNQPSGPSAQDVLNEGYNSYYSQLDEMMGGLDPQRQAQEGIVASQYNQGISDLKSQREQGLYDLGTQKTAVATSQSKNLRDLASNMRNMFLSGNIYLGARGAGDSSAANMYSYALTKLGNRARGDIMGQATTAYSQIADREFKLDNIYKQETNRLGSERDQKINSIASWFADAQNQIRSMRAGAQKEYSNAVLNQALQALNQADVDARNQRSMLDQWVVSNAKSLAEAKSGMSSNAAYMAPAIKSGPIAGNITSDSSGNMYQGPATGYGYASSKYDIYGNPIA